MKRRVVAAIIAAAGCVAAFEAAASAASDHTPGRAQRVALVGCVAKAPDGAFQLRNATRASMAPRTGGANSAKASTPIGGGSPSIDRPRTPGATTAKGSTPANVSLASFTPSGTGGANSPKASTPVALTPPSYALAAAGADLAAQAGHIVEVIGLLEQRMLTVETVRPIAGDCAR